MKDENLWVRLSQEGRFNLINKLRHVELGEGGFGTVVIPGEGFSDDDTTHNMVIDFLRSYSVNILNKRSVVEKLKRSLRS